MADRGAGQIAFSQIGLGALLKQYRLRVPANQREYAWTKKEVTTLLQDFGRAITGDEGEYFLGTIVTIPKSPDELEVVDGQQRLATTAILLAEIRDHLKEREPVIANAIQDQMLSDVDRKLRQHVPKLRLNLDDNEFFKCSMGGEKPKPQRESHKLIASAFREARNQVRNIVSTVDEKSHGDVLNAWLEFIEHRAQVILLRVPTERNAYKMFETLNDRGLKTSQSDLVKNYLFGQAGDRIGEAQQKWALIRGTLDSLDEDDITIAFLRAILMVLYGYLREPEVYDRVQYLSKGPHQSVSFLSTAESLSHGYVAMLNADHEKWNGYPSNIRRAIRTLNVLNVRLMRPLMLAVATKFSNKEAALAFEKFISWEVRFLIAGNTRTGGAIELPIAHAAKRVYAGEIATARALSADLASQGAVPTDEEFQRQFEVATVAKASLARYYLRSLENQAKEAMAPWYMPNDSQEAINLEHILPEDPEGNWPEFTDDQASLYVRRLGNLALLRASQNSDLRSAGFQAKRKVYAAAPYELTSQVAGVDSWSLARIEERQRILADLAVKTWPL